MFPPIEYGFDGKSYLIECRKSSFGYKKLRVAKRVKTIEYAIRDVIEYAKELENKGKEITYLNIGDPVKFDFDTPEHIKQALVQAVKDGFSWYSPSEGIPDLREAICEKEKRVNCIDILPENVVVSAGVSEGIQMIIGALVDRGEEILVPGPTYPPYISYAKFFEGIPVPYRTSEGSRWQPDVDDIRSKITDKTQAIVVINPNNPCGALYDEKIVKAIADLAGEYDIPLISDEIYDKIVYEKRFVSTSYAAKDVPVIGLNGFSKVYMMTGWRIGYVYFHWQEDRRLKELRECVTKEARIRLCANTLVQKAAVQALKGPQDHIHGLVSKLRERRDYSHKRLKEIDGVSCIKPEGTFFFFPKVDEMGSRWKNDMEFVRSLLEKTGVLFVHGSGFGAAYGSGHFRGVFLPPIETLEMAFHQLERFMSSK